MATSKCCGAKLEWRNGHLHCSQCGSRQELGHRGVRRWGVGHHSPGGARVSPMAACSPS